MEIRIELRDTITMDGWNKEIQKIISNRKNCQEIRFVGPNDMDEGMTSDHASSFIKNIIQAFCRHSLRFQSIVLERVDLAWCDELFAFLADQDHNTSCRRMRFAECTQNENSNSLVNLMQSQSIAELIVIGMNVPAEVVENLTNLETLHLVNQRFDSLVKAFHGNQGPRRLRLSMFGTHGQHNKWVDLADSLVGNEKVEELLIFKGRWNQRTLHAFINSIGTMPNLGKCSFLTCPIRRVQLKLSEVDDTFVLEQVRNFHNHQLETFRVDHGLRFHDNLRTPRMIRYELIRKWAGAIVRETTSVPEGLWGNILNKSMSKYDDPLDRMFYFLQQKPELMSRVVSGRKSKLAQASR